MAKIMVIHGPNLNLLGLRETSEYGNVTLPFIDDRLKEIAKKQGHTLSIFQSNAEHALIEQIHAAHQAVIDFIIINPAAFTHTSIGLRDALLGVSIPFIEVHLSNIFKREKYRHHSYFSDIAIGVITGFGHRSYELALQAAHDYLSNKGF